MADQEPQTPTLIHQQPSASNQVAEPVYYNADSNFQPGYVAKTRAHICCGCCCDVRNENQKALCPWRCDGRAFLACLPIYDDFHEKITHENIFSYSFSLFSLKLLLFRAFTDSTDGNHRQYCQHRPELSWHCHDLFSIGRDIFGVSRRSSWISDGDRRLVNLHMGVDHCANRACRLLFHWFPWS